jgi:TPR repeat protein
MQRGNIDVLLSDTAKELRMINYLTRHRSAPYGKAYVWFCAHPDDHNAYVTLITERIHALKDCAIWYDDRHGAVRPDEIFACLNQARLMVAVISEKCFSTSGYVFCEEFEYAKSKNIPILPILVDDGIEGTFNKCCGNMHCLKFDKTGNDTLFRHSLKAFLDMVIIDDDLLEKARNAFQSYIFLSYRKKDREHIDKLISLIQRYDFCFDIALWYDEFLTPGENFDDSILTVLEKSQLFLIAVTPNLTEKDNYIMRIEYPEATKHQKTILPVELLPTDKAELRACFPEMPDCISICDEKDVEDKLREILPSGNRNKSDTQHYYIGLAYLNGISVTKNVKTALQLLTEASDHGFTPATEQLASIYYVGDRTQRDTDKAIKLQQLCFDKYEEDYRTSHTEQAAVCLLKALRRLASMKWKERTDDTFKKYDMCTLRDLEPIKEIKLLEEYAATVSAEFDSLNVSYALCDVYFDLYEMYFAKDDTHNGEKCLLSRLEQLIKIADRTGTVDARLAVAECYSELAINIKYISSSIKYYDMELGEYERLADEINTLDLRRLLTSKYIEYWDLWRAATELNTHSDLGYADEFDMKHSYLTAMVKSSESVAKESRSSSDMRNLYDAYHTYAYEMKDAVHQKIILKYFKKALYGYEKELKAEYSNAVAEEYCLTCLELIIFTFNEGMAFNHSYYLRRFLTFVKNMEERISSYRVASSTKKLYELYTKSEATAGNNKLLAVLGWVYAQFDPKSEKKADPSKEQ